MAVRRDYKVLLSGYGWADGTASKSPVVVTYSFDKKLRGYQKDDPDFKSKTIASFTALSSTEKNRARDAFEDWSDAAGIRFVEVKSGKGDIALGKIDFTGHKVGGFDYGKYSGYASYPLQGLLVDDPVWGSASYALPGGGDVFFNTSRGTASQLTIAHEIGHAIGLKHPHDGPDTLARSLDNTGNTVMSYNHTDRSGELGRFDEQAAKALYGPAKFKSGTLKSIDYEDNVLTQKWGKASSLIQGSSGKDSVSAGGGDDKLLGHGGKDSLKGGRGDDLIVAGKGKDVLDGKKDSDRLAGEKGDDTFVFARGYGADVVEDFNVWEGDGDILQLNRNLWGGADLTAQDVVDLYGIRYSGDLRLDFGNGDVLTVRNIYQFDAEASIRIV